MLVVQGCGALQDLTKVINQGSNDDIQKDIWTDIQKFLENLSLYITPTGEGVSKQCESDGQLYKAALLSERPLWAVRMLDADPKFPQAGLTDGNVVDFPGAFDTCLKADSGSFRGKYCLMGLGAGNINDFPPPGRMGPPPPQTRSFAQIPKEYQYAIKTAICIPSSCNEEDARNGMNNYLFATTLDNKTGEFFFSYPLGCQSEDTEIELSSGDWAMVAVLVLFALVISLATCIDMASKYFCPNLLHDKILGIVQGFSAYNNIRKLFDATPSSENLGCINGIRFISMTWVVIGHTFQNFTMPTGIGFWSNILYIFDIKGPASPTASAAIWNADSSVDTFFLIGAILLSYLTLKMLDKKKSSVQTWAMFYVHRYLRLSGVYAMVIFLQATLLIHIVNYGPQGHLLDYESQSCKDNWWVNLLYLANFNIRNEDPYYGPMCMGVTWYLMVDMQLFIFTPLIIYPLWKVPKYGLVLSGIVTFASTVIPLSIVWADDEFFSKGGWSGDFVKFYTKPWNRIQPYIVGLLVGFLLYKLRDKPRLPINWVVNWICWLVAGAVACACIYGIADYFPTSQKEPEHYKVVLYCGLNRLAWSLAISWVIVACIKEMGGPVNDFLSWSWFVPGARISYCMYLAHWTVVSWHNSVQKNNTTYSTEVYIYYCLGNMLMTAGAALALVICFEMPILHAEKLLFGILGLAVMPQPRKEKKSFDEEKNVKK